jgi:hypothetical protein
MLQTKISHTKGDEFLVELVNPQAPNGRPLSQKFVASFGDLLGLKDAIEQTERGSRRCLFCAVKHYKLPPTFEEKDGSTS